MQRSEMRTKGGYMLDEVVSALQKSIRRGLEQESLYWSLELAESGFGQYLWKRLLVISSEDIGLADPMALILTHAAWASTKETTLSFAKPPGMRTEFLGVAVLYLARACKNREGDDAVWLAMEKRKRGWKLDVPDYALDFHTAAGRKLKRGMQFWFDEAAKLQNEVEIGGNPYGQLVREMLADSEQEPSPSQQQGEP